MRIIDSWRRSRGLDFTPVLFATVLVFVVVAAAQFLGSLPSGERGLLLFEKACAIYSRA
jgi:hypothetical protein